MSDDLEALILALRIQADTKDAQPKVDALADGLDRVGNSAAKAKSSLSGLGADKAIPPSAPQQANKLAEGIEKIEPATKKASSGLFSMKNMARTALGTFEAMAIFLVTKFIGDAIKKAIGSIMQLEKAVMNLTIAEKALSRAGVDIIPEDFEKIAEAVRATGIAISKIDLTNLIANTAAGTTDLKLSVQQLQDLSIATAAIAYANGKTVEEVQNTIQTSLTTSGRGLKPLDIPVDAAMIKEKAIEAQLVKNAEAYDALTAAEKQKVETDALLLIVTDKANQILSETDNLAGSVTSTTKQLSVEWENFTTALGELLKFPIVGFGNALIIYLQIWSNGFVVLGLAFGEFMGAMVGGISVIAGFADGSIKSITDVKNAFTAASDEMKTTIFSGMFPGGVPDLEFGTAETGKLKLLTDQYDKYVTAIKDTPTVPTSGDGALGVDENLQKALEKMNNEILEAQLKLAQDMEDAAIDLGRKMEDITIEYAKKRAEAEIDYASKVSDINRDYANKIADINAKQAESRAKFRADEQQKEREHQNKLQEMREKFLMDLDDALHARDARQILKLIKQYDLDKLQAERDFALQQESARKEEELRQKSFANERASAERDRKAKLADAQRDYADKLAKLRADEEAERAAAQLKYEREKQDLEKAMQDRLEIVAANLIAEFNLTQEGLGAIVNLYRQYYAEVSGIYAAMQTMMAGAGALMPRTGQRGVTTAPRSGGKTTGSGWGKMAEGGTIIANQPTSVVFGEAGMEAATFTPIGRTGQDVNKIFSSLSGEGGGNMGGAVSIELLLSPDLESRIVSNTLNKTAQVFTKIQRSKK